MSDLIAIAHPDRPTAERVRARLDNAIKARLVKVDDVVIVTSDEQGKVKLLQNIDEPGQIIQTSLSNVAEARLSETLAVGHRSGVRAACAGTIARG